jgi:hypothetical protein
MGPPLGHVRDPNKQVRFVENELSALLQAAGGTLPVIKKDEERGVFIMIETEVADHGGHAKPAPAAKAAAPAKPAAATATPATTATAKPAAPKPAAASAASEHKALGTNPNRQLFKRSTYVGVQDTGPVAGETFEQKVARLKALSAAAKQRQDEGGAEAAPVAQAAPIEAASASESAAEAVVQSPAEITAPTPAPASSSPAHAPTGNADRSLFKRSTYCGVKDTGPVPGESFEQKVARLAALAAAAKQRSEGG